MSVSKSLILLLGASFTDIVSADHHGHYGSPFHAASHHGQFGGMSCDGSVTLNTTMQNELSASSQCTSLVKETFPDYEWHISEPSYGGGETTEGLCAPFGAVWQQCEPNYKVNGTSGPGQFCNSTALEMGWATGSPSPAEWRGYVMPGKRQHPGIRGLCPPAPTSGYNGAGPIAFLMGSPGATLNQPPVLQNMAQKIMCGLQCDQDSDCPEATGSVRKCRTHEIPHGQSKKICTFQFSVCGNQTFNQDTHGCCGTGKTATVYHLSTHGCCKDQAHNLLPLHTVQQMCGQTGATGQCKCGYAANDFCVSSASGCCQPSYLYEQAAKWLGLPWNNRNEDFPYAPNYIWPMNPAAQQCPSTLSSTVQLWSSSASSSMLTNDNIKTWRELPDTTEKTPEGLLTTVNSKDKWTEPTLSALASLETQREEEDAASNLMVHSVWAIVAISVIKHFAFVF